MSYGNITNGFPFTHTQYTLVVNAYQVGVKPVVVWSEQIWLPSGMMLNNTVSGGQDLLILLHKHCSTCPTSLKIIITHYWDCAVWVLMSQW